MQQSGIQGEIHSLGVRGGSLARDVRFNKRARHRARDLLPGARCSRTIQKRDKPCAKGVKVI